MEIGVSMSHAFIYAFNDRGKRMELWEELRRIKISEPWLICGDFNCVMSVEERIGAQVRETEMVDLRACMTHCGLQDIKSSGNFYTWNNKQEGIHRVFSKIDRMVANQSWLDLFSTAEASFHNEGEFDHTLVILTIHPGLHGRKKPFKYFTMWRSSPKFLEIIRKHWMTEVQGTKMFQIQKKLKSIKVDLKRLNKEGYSDIQVANVKAYQDMMEAQLKLHENPKEHRAILNAPYTEAEIKKALFSNPGSKAPGTDGYGTYFYRDTWEVIEEDIIAAVLDSLQSGRILKEVNTTVITLIPKNSCPKNVKEYRPISCCNTLYKCITKVLCNRLRLVLPDLIMENQGGFVHGRSIIHNIMVIQDLVKHYGRKQTQPGFLLKIDLHKAYATVNWEFLGEMLEALGFPSQFMQLVMECVTTPKFSLMINGVMEEYFSSSRGLRQGDPISPFLFVLYVLIMCCRGDYASIYLKLRAFKLFSMTTVDKMIAKIKVWSSRNLSYTARVQLVNAVLVLHRITKICRSFLWSGQYFTLKAGNVAWEKICTPKSAGGLGFRDIFKWNRACLGRYVWAISTKQDSVWLKWVHSVYLKGGYWWEYTPNTSSSWYWRKLCQVKEQLKQSFTQAEIRNMRQYSVKHVYEVLMGEQERVHWDRVI
ncbi:uncharacterized protein LOC125498836 [Beta vulgaris subsp. vulgaris]|uniref:uncharacterized protein LOC125498836 n=1 Tax=Beta vulgaris subsp. vulgaris TaxID=3555 RepID=UPI00254821E7|nr:uncharacterized protein LOC125498836 [Beta vulgaris subsp. vulgaris]